MNSMVTDEQVDLESLLTGDSEIACDSNIKVASAFGQVGAEDDCPEPATHVIEKSCGHQNLACDRHTMIWATAPLGLARCVRCDGAIVTMEIRPL